MIRLNDQRKVYWEIIIICFALYNCLETPIEIAFDPEWA
jgi:Ion transport protein/Cyclic nucleotide-binding domain